MRASANHFPRRCYGDNTWHHEVVSSPMVGSSMLCGSSSKFVANLDVNPAVNQISLTEEQRREAAASYDPYPIRTPSHSLSADADSSYKGSISPPRHDRFQYMGLDDGHSPYGTTGQAPVENQDNTSSTRQGVPMDLLIGQQADNNGVTNMEFGNQGEDGMDFSVSWAAAHGPNAPHET